MRALTRKQKPSGSTTSSRSVRRARAICALRIRNCSKTSCVWQQSNAILGKFNVSYKGTVSVRHLLWMLIDDIGLGRAFEDGHESRCAGSRSRRSTVAISSGRSRSTAGNRRVIRTRSKISSRRSAESPSTMPARRVAAASTCNSRKTESPRTWSARICAWPKITAPKPFSRRAPSAISPSTDTKRIRSRAGAAPICRPSTLPQLVALALGVDPTLLGLKRHVISPGAVLLGARARADARRLSLRRPFTSRGARRKPGAAFFCNVRLFR